MMFSNRMKEIEADVPDWGFHDDGIGNELVEVDPGDGWSIAGGQEWQRNEW